MEEDLLSVGPPLPLQRAFYLVDCPALLVLTDIQLGRCSAEVVAV